MASNRNDLNFAERNSGWFAIGGAVVCVINALTGYGHILDRFVDPADAVGLKLLNNIVELSRTALIMGAVVTLLGTVAHFALRGKPTDRESPAGVASTPKSE